MLISFTLKSSISSSNVSITEVVVSFILLVGFISNRFTFFSALAGIFEI